MVKDITELNFQKMKDLGMEKLLFTKKHVLEDFHEPETGFINEGICRAFRDAVDIFG